VLLLTLSLSAQACVVKSPHHSYRDRRSPFLSQEDGEIITHLFRRQLNRAVCLPTCSHLCL